MANDPQVPESDFDVLLADEQAQSANQIKQSMFVASKQDPDRAAQIVDLTKKTGVPYDLADRKFEDLKSRSDYEYLDYGGIVEKTPALAGYLKDPAKASVSKDDIDNLKNLETTYKDYGIFRSSFEALNSGLAQFNATAARIPALAYSLYTLPQNAVAKFTGDKSYEAKVPDWLLNNPVAKFYDEEAVKHQIPDLETDIIDEISSGNYGRASRGILAKAIQSAPSSLAAMGAAITTGGAGSFAVAASQAGSQAVKDGADSKADPFSQTANALYAGIFEGGIEAIGDVSILKAWEKSIAKRFGKEVSKQVFTDVIKNFAYGSVIEGGGEFATSIAQDYSSFATGVNPDAMTGAGKRALEAGIVGAASGVMFESPTAFLEAHHNRVQARQAAMARDFYLSMGEGAEASKTRQRVPEFQRQFVDKITENGNVKDVYIPVEAMQTYFQKKDISLAQAAQELGISKQVDEAVQTGGDVRLPLSEWVDKVVSTEHYKGLADDIRFHEGDLTLNEAKVALEKMKSDVQDADLAATESVRAEDDQIRQVVSYFQEQAKAAGIKKDQAEILRSIAVQAMRNGQDPIAFAKGLNLQITRGNSPAQGTQVFNQDSERLVRARQMGFDTSQVYYHGTNANIKGFFATDRGVLGPGIYFAKTPDGRFGADQYASLSVPGANIVQTYLKITSPLDWQGPIPEKLLKALNQYMKKHYGPEFQVRANDSRLETVGDLIQRRYRELNSDSWAEIMTKAGYDAVVDSESGYTSVINPEQIRSVNAEFNTDKTSSGLILSQGDIASPLGQISFGDNQISISLLKSANASTFFHELGHLNLEIMQRLANDGGESAKADLKILRDWFGLKDGESIGVNQHEQFARGFEKYLGEGVAPSQSLERIFKKFKYWIMSVYQNLRGLNVELTNEVRDVMGRMLATEAEIQSAEITMARDPLFKDPASVGMNDAQAERYIRARDEARAESEKLLLVKMMVDANKMRRQDYREKRAEIRGVVEKQVDESQVYKSIKALQENDTIKLDKSAFSKDEAKAAPKGIFAKKGGMNLDVVAPILGFSSGLELKETLLKAPSRNQIIEERVQEMMDKIYPDITRSDSDLTNAAIEALHNDSEAKLLRMELEHLASMNLPVLQDAIKRVARRVPTDAEVREEAKSIIDAKAIKDVRPSLYQRAEIKAAKQAGELLAKGDIDGAFRAKRLELLNHELYRAAVEAKNIVDKTIADGKKRFKKDLDVAKSRDTDIVNAMRAIYAEFSLAKPLDKTSDQYLELIKKYDVDTYNTMRSLVDAAVENAGDYQEVSFSAFSAMKDAVDALWELSKSVKEMEVDGKRIDRDTVKAELDARIKEFWPVSKKSGYDKAVSDRDKLAMKILNARAAGIRVEHWVDVVDVKGDGPFRKYIWNPISEGTTKYRLSKAEVLKSYEGVLREWAKGIGKNPIRSQELNYEFRDKTELMMALLHSGNESNLSKLLRGRGWGSENFEGILDTSRWDAFIARAQKEGVLTKEDYDAAQKIWDLMDSLKPDAQRAHKKMYGAYFNEITARELNTPFGKYKGGYIPAKVDLYLNSDAKIRADREAFEKNNNSFQFPTTGRGFTKSRVDSYAAPLSLELSLLGGHIDSVLRFTHIEPRVKDVSRIVNDDSFRQALASVDPSAASEMLVPWLQRSAQQRVVLPSQSGAGKLIDSFASVLRKNVAMQIMVGNFSNAAQQFTGMVVAMTRVGPRFIRDGLVSYVNSHSRTIDFMIEKSEYMRSTQGSNVYETQAAIDKIIADPDWKDNVKAFASKHTYFLQSATQNIVNTVVWTGAFNQAVEQGMADSDAIKKADSAVRMTQGTNNAEDISRVETGTATQRLFTQFAGYFNMLANLNAGELIKIQKEVGLKKGAGRAFYVYMTGLAIPAILSAAITKALAGKGLDEDDDGYLDDMLALFFGSQTSTLTAMIPGAGQAINNVANRFNSNMYDDRLSMSPVVSTVESMLGVPAEVFYATLTDKKVNSTRVTKDALSALGVLSGLPIGPLGKPVGYVMDVSKGKIKPAKGPIARPLDFGRGLLTGKGASK